MLQNYLNSFFVQKMSKIGKKPIYITSDIHFQKKESQLIIKNPISGIFSPVENNEKKTQEGTANNISLKVNINIPLTVVAVQNNTVLKKNSGANLQILALTSICKNFLPTKKQLSAKRLTSKTYNKMWGTLRAQIFNTIRGLYKQHTIRFKFIGVGFKANLKKDFFILRLGFSHRLFFKLPPTVQISQIKKRPPTFLLKSNDLDLIKNTAFILRAFKKPEPYKGKGIVLVNEQIKLKEGMRKA